MNPSERAMVAVFALAIANLCVWVGIFYWIFRR